MSRHRRPQQKDTPRRPHEDDNPGRHGHIDADVGQRHAQPAANVSVPVYTVHDITGASREALHAALDEIIDRRPEGEYVITVRTGNSVPPAVDAVDAVDIPPAVNPYEMEEGVPVGPEMGYLSDY